MVICWEYGYFARVLVIYWGVDSLLGMGNLLVVWT